MYHLLGTPLLHTVYTGQGSTGGYTGSTPGRVVQAGTLGRVTSGPRAGTLGRVTSGPRAGRPGIVTFSMREDQESSPSQCGRAGVTPLVLVRESRSNTSGPSAGGTRNRHFLEDAGRTRNRHFLEDAGSGPELLLLEAGKTRNRHLLRMCRNHQNRHFLRMCRNHHFCHFWDQN